MSFKKAVFDALKAKARVTALRIANIQVDFVLALHATNCVCFTDAFSLNLDCVRKGHGERLVYAI